MNVSEKIKDYNITIINDCEYTGYKNKFTVECNKCGYVYDTCLDYLHKGRSCPQCSKNNRPSQKFTHSDFINKVNKLEYANEYTFLSEYQDYHTKMKVKHNCGYEYEVSPAKFLSGKKCPYCNGGIKYTKEVYAKKFYEVHDKKDYELLTDYIDKTTHMRVLIKKDNRIYETDEPLIILRKDFKFKYNKQLSMHKDSYKDEIFSILGNEYEILDDYKNSSTPIQLLHKKCGIIYKRYPSDIFQFKTGKCPKCTIKNRSSKEIELYNFIKEILPNNVIINNYKLNSYEIDIYIPEYNIGIEFDGIYYHSKYDINRHIDKTKLCAENNIRLIHIFEDEWDEKKDLVKNKLKHILNIDTSDKVFARKCIVKEVDTDDKNEFLDKYHIQGKDRSNIKLGLYYSDDLVAVMTFCNPRMVLGNKNKNDGKYELSRYATSCNVIGGFSKLLSYFKKHYEYKSIITYADLRWTAYPTLSDSVYTKNGFIFNHISKPNYYYVKSHKRYARYNFMKHLLKKKFPEFYSDNKTEMEIMKDAKYNVIYDCGNACYILEK